MVRKWIGQFQIENACLHFEARCRPQALYESHCDVNKNFAIGEFIMPIEMNTRLGGAESWSMCKAAFGVDLLEEYLNICLGVKLDAVKLNEMNKHVRYNCISTNFDPFSLKRNLKHIEIDAQSLKEDESVVQVMMTYKPESCFGWLIMKADKSNGYQQMVELFEERLKLFKFEYF